MADYEPVLLRNVGVENSTSLEVYRSRGGYQALAKALKMTPQEIVEEVKGANLRGRGGAGFPAGVKWTFLPTDRTHTYLCVNGDESEPPTFSNRVLIENDPHQLLEGTIISAYATAAADALSKNTMGAIPKGVHFTIVNNINRIRYIPIASFSSNRQGKIDLHFHLL